MRIKEHSKAAVCCFMACVAGSLFFSMSNQAQAQITYTVTGVVNNRAFGFPGEVAGEPYTAVFEIDDSVVDSDPEDEEFGRYLGAIVSSSVIFHNGYTSTVDFSGGDVVVRTDSSGGGVFLWAPGDNGFFLLYSLTSFDSDALLTDPQEITELPGSILSLNETVGSFFSINPDNSDSEFVAVAAFAVTAPRVVLGDCNQDEVVNFSDIPPFIEVLTTGDYMAEADANQSGHITFEDIPPFINLLLGQPAAY